MQSKIWRNELIKDMTPDDFALMLVEAAMGWHLWIEAMDIYPSGRIEYVIRGLEEATQIFSPQLIMSATLANIDFAMEIATEHLEDKIREDPYAMLALAPDDEREIAHKIAIHSKYLYAAKEIQEHIEQLRLADTFPLVYQKDNVNLIEMDIPIPYDIVMYAMVTKAGREVLFVEGLDVLIPQRLRAFSYIKVLSYA